MKKAKMFLGLAITMMIAFSSCEKDIIGDEIDGFRTGGNEVTIKNNESSEAVQEGSEFIIGDEIDGFRNRERNN